LIWASGPSPKLLSPSLPSFRLLFVSFTSGVVECIEEASDVDCAYGLFSEAEVLVEVDWDEVLEEDLNDGMAKKACDIDDWCLC